MEKKPRKKKRDYDFNVSAFRVVQETTTKPEPVQGEEPTPEGKNPHAVALGRLGGKKGGKARAARLTPEQRREIARKAAKTRWERETSSHS